jgi:hypothetical protein
VHADEKLTAFLELEAANWLDELSGFFKLDAVWNKGQGSRKLFLAVAFSPFSDLQSKGSTNHEKRRSPYVSVNSVKKPHNVYCFGGGVDLF